MIEDLVKDMLDNDPKIKQAKQWQKSIDKQLELVSAENQRLNEKSHNLSTAAKLVQETFHDELERLTPTQIQQDMLEHQTRRHTLQPTRADQELQQQED